MTTMKDAVEDILNHLSLLLLDADAVVFRYR